MRTNATAQTTTTPHEAGHCPTCGASLPEVGWLEVFGVRNCSLDCMVKTAVRMKRGQDGKAASPLD
jgi:hypothetical protein